MTKIQITSIKPNPENPRFIRDEKFDKLVESLRDFPQMLNLRPLVVNNEGVLLGGNMRLKALEKLGYTEIPSEWVKNASDLTPEQEREFIIKDNLGFGEWDWEMINADWDVEELTAWGMDVPPPPPPSPGGDEDDNFEPAPEIETDIQPGDIITIGRHRLLCGDCRNPEHVALLMNGEKADLAHNDPPYGMKKEAEGVANDNLNFADLLEFNQFWISVQIAHLKENGSLYIWGIDEPLMDIYSHVLKPLQDKGVLTFRNLITWDKACGQGQNSEWTRSYATADEKCLFVMMGKQNLIQNKDQFPEEWRPLLNYFIQEKDRMKWTVKDCQTITGVTSASHYFTESQFMIPTAEAYAKLQDAADGKAFDRPFDALNKESNSILDEFKASRAYFNNVHDNMNNVWHFDRHVKDGSEGNHATPKPLPLCSRVIRSSCPPGGIVADFFVGSGSTMVAAESNDRICYAMELEPKYCQVTVDRMLKNFPELVVTRNGKNAEQ